MAKKVAKKGKVEEPKDPANEYLKRQLVAAEFRGKILREKQGRIQHKLAKVELEIRDLKYMLGIKPAGES